MTADPAPHTGDPEDRWLIRRQLKEDVELAAQKRQAKREAQLGRDIYLPDSRREAYLDTTILVTSESAELLNMGESWISEMRGGRKVDPRGKPLAPKEPPHPEVFVPPATIVSWRGGVPGPGNYRGEVIEWAEQRGTHVYDPKTKTMIRIPVRQGPVLGVGRKKNEDE